MKLSRGLLVSVEGIDGCGKSSFMLAIKKLLEEHSLPFLLTKEPGDTPLGKHIREILLSKTVDICPKAEYLLFAVDRAQHFHEVVSPALCDIKIVVSDRMADSSLIYQGYARGLEIDVIQNINQWAMNNIAPDIVFYLKIDVATA